MQRYPLRFCAVGVVICFVLVACVWGAQAGETGVQARGVAADSAFSFVVTTDLHLHFKRPGDRPPTLEHAFGKIAEVGPGAFMISAGDYWDIEGVREIMDRHFGKAYPWYFALGNHDGEYRETMAFARRYNDGGNRLPGIVNPGPPNGRETTYSFDYANCHFVILNQYYDGTSDSQRSNTLSKALLDWLAADLAKTKQPHILVIGHEPAFRHPDREWHNPRAGGGGYLGYKSLEQRDRFWDLLREKGVLAYVHGHHHVYNYKRMRDVWDIAAGYCVAFPGKEHAIKRSAFLIFRVAEDKITMDSYRDTPDDPAFHFYDAVTLCGGKHSAPPCAKTKGAICVMDSDGDGKEAITLDGTDSFDGSGPIQSYVWEREGEFLARDPEAEIVLPVGYYRDIALIVTNRHGVENQDAFSVWVKPQSFTGVPPKVNVGDDADISVGEALMLQGQVRDDGKSIPAGELKTRWSKQQGPGTVTFGNFKALRTTATFSRAGTYVLQLVAFYGEIRAYDTIKVSVR